MNHENRAIGHIQNVTSQSLATQHLSMIKYLLSQHTNVATDKLFFSRYIDGIVASFHNQDEAVTFIEAVLLNTNIISCNESQALTLVQHLIDAKAIHSLYKVAEKSVNLQNVLITFTTLKATSLLLEPLEVELNSEQEEPSAKRLRIK